MQHCRTITLTDEPEEIDAFSGPHQRIAGAVAQLIQPEDAKGISIGIEGNWGSGKSTVARLLTNRLEADTNITVISFDAWAHEGDPLRRTFLETIIRKLQKRKWVDEKTWDECIEELANRREVVKTKDSLTITRSGKLIAFILLLIPIGGAFITAALREDITLVPGATAWKFLILFFTGLALTFIPLLVLFRRIKHEPDIVGFLFNKGPTEKTTETSKTANPTSIEFEDSFQRLFKEALEGDREKHQRRVVLILDNLDRIDSKDALVIWSTLQTFLQHKGTSRPDWHERVWLLVLYDVSGLSKLWSNSNENEAAISFIDKSFQIRFEVPALVLSDWRHFLITQLEKAFPDHTESDFHEVYRILAIWIAQKKHLTIRELKLFVNQIGSVHRQWAGAAPTSDTFTLALTAYYALLRRNDTAIDISLYDPEFPGKEYEELLGGNVRENLAALAFNVEVDVAQQLLFSDKIKEALTLGEKDELARVASLLRRGFWEVFEEVAKDWANSEFVQVADAALAMEESGILSIGFMPSVRSVTKCFCDRAASVGAWSPMDAKRARGVAILLKWKKELKGPAEHLQQFIDRLSTALALGLTVVDLKLSAKEWLDHLHITLKELDSDTQQRLLTTIVKTLNDRLESGEALVPFQVELILEVLCELHERSELTALVEKHLRGLTDGGKIALQLRTETAHNATSVAWITYILIRYSSTFDGLPFQKEDKEKALPFLSDAHFVEAFVGILERYKDTSLLFNLGKREPALQPLAIASLKIIINEDYASELFATEDAVDRLEFVSSHLGHNDAEEAGLLKLISEVSRHLTDELTSKSFNSSNANLYLLVLKAGGQNQDEFVSWCVHGLRSVGAENWIQQLHYQDLLLKLAFYLENLEVNVELGGQYFQALCDSLNFPNWQFVSNDRANLASLLGPLGSPFRNAFLKELENRIRSDDQLPSWFFEAFGLELKTQLLHGFRSAKVVELLTRILNRRDQGGMVWLRYTFMESGKSLDLQYSKDVAWTDFKQSIRRALITDRSEDKRYMVESIASGLNISVPKNGLIAFGTPERDKICTLDPNSLETKVLIKGALPDYGLVTQPSWSPDGKKLAYAGRSEPSGQSEIFILDYSSGNTIKVTDTSKSSHQPSLSPDGKMLALVRGEGPYSDIFTVNLETSEERRLTATDAINEHPKWSPDGRMLVFRRLINHQSQIFVMRADGSNKLMITPGPGDFDPSWSPDEGYITFVRSQEFEQKSGIYSVSLEGTAPQFVPENHAHSPVWSPDGTKLLFQVGMDAEARIYQVDANGQNKKELTKGVSPTWQPVLMNESDLTKPSAEIRAAAATALILK